MASPRDDSSGGTSPRPGSSRKYPRLLVVWASLVLIIPTFTIFLFSVAPYNAEIFCFSLKKYSWPALDTAMALDTLTKAGSTAKQELKDTASRSGDSGITVIKIKGKYSEDGFFTQDAPAFTDTTHHRILLIGDSEAEGLVYPLNDYCIANNHKLVGCVKWYSATVFNFAKSDTIVKIVRKFNPTYVMVVVGLNEIYARDLKDREKAAKLLVKKLQGRPYCWIGPANWVEDFGINNVFARSADPGTFYLTKKLTLPRAGDGRHPNVAGYYKWMDSVGAWLNQSARWKLKMVPPKKRYQPLKSPVIYFNAVNFRGY